MRGKSSIHRKTTTIRSSAQKLENKFFYVTTLKRAFKINKQRTRGGGGESRVCAVLCTETDRACSFFFHSLFLPSSLPFSLSSPFTRSMTIKRTVWCFPMSPHCSLNESQHGRKKSRELPFFLFFKPSCFINVNCMHARVTSATAVIPTSNTI